jgi:hypothetical protein
MFLKIQDGDFILNINQISDIDCSDPKCWEVTMTSGHEYTIEGKDLTALKKAMGL